jgi:hypothetical protein
MAEPISKDLISLREYIDMRFGEQKEAVNAALIAADKAVNAALSAADRAVAKAEIATDKRFDGVNEFRAALSDNSRLLMPRAEAEQSFRVLSQKIDDVGIRLKAREDRGLGGANVWAILISVIAIAVSIATVYVMAKH